MELFGVDLSALPTQVVEGVKLPDIVPGRWLEIDGDFLAYMVSAHEDTPLGEMQHNCEVAANKLRLRAGAEFMRLHLTPKESDKGYRYEIAMIKEYQATRKNKPKPKNLALIRDYMAKSMGAVDWTDAEADDGMAINQYTAIAAGNHNLTMIASKDKDLQMVPGMSLNWDTGEITDTKDEPFGWITLDRSKTQPKIRGRGWKFFWSQMLTGDQADNISGLPKARDEKGAWKPVGAVGGFALLESIKSQKEAYNFVRDLYKEYGEDPKLGFFDYRDKTKISWQKAFISEAQLLWMRRVNHKGDVFNWFKETCI